MILPILKMGAECLKQIAQPLNQSEFNTELLDEIITNMHDTLRESGGVGLAAPQVGISKRIVLVEYNQALTKRYSDIGNCSLKVIINPELEFIGDEYTAFNEGCLSLPNLRGEVIRPKIVKYKYFDELGNLHSGQDDGFFARVLQHEIDHLDGILYPMRMHDMSKLQYIEN